MVNGTHYERGNYCKFVDVVSFVFKEIKKFVVGKKYVLRVEIFRQVTKNKLTNNERHYFEYQQSLLAAPKFLIFLNLTH